MNDRKRQITALQFALNELNLYMDLHPEDPRAKALWQRYQTELARRLNENAQTGAWPLRSDMHADRAEWVSEPWPWEASAN